MCTGVYGPNDNNVRGHIWDELVGIQYWGHIWDELVGIQYWTIPLCYIGDFNIVHVPSEQRGGSRLTLAMEKFSEFIEDLNLIYLPLEGGRYTWSSGTDRPSMSRPIQEYTGTDKISLTASPSPAQGSAEGF